MTLKVHGLVSGWILKTKSNLILGALDKILPIDDFPFFAHFWHLRFEIEAKYNYFVARVALGFQIMPRNLKPQPWGWNNLQKAFVIPGHRGHKIWWGEHAIIHFKLAFGFFHCQKLKWVSNMHWKHLEVFRYMPIMLSLLQNYIHTSLHHIVSW